MPRDPRVLLQDMSEAADRLLCFHAGRTLEQFHRDDMLRSAVERQFEILGEALRQLRAGSPELAERIPDAHRIIGLRNLLAHAYADVSPEILWDALESKAPELAHAVRRLIAEPDG